MDKREKNLNQLNGTENTATNMTVNTQEASHEEQQPLQPAQEQNPIPTLYRESGIILDKTTRTSLETALSYMIKEDKAKRYLIYLDEENVNYFDGKLELQTTMTYGAPIFLLDEKQKPIEDLQSYFNEKKVIYCYNPEQYEYIGHFKKTEKGISVSQSNKEPTQSQEQPKEQTNAKSQLTESTPTMQQTRSSEQLQEKEYELADYQSTEHIFNYPTHPKNTKEIEATEYAKQKLYNACMGLILNDGDIESYKDIQNPQLRHYSDGTTYLHFNGKVGDEYSVKIESTCVTFGDLLEDLENSKKRKKHTISQINFLNTPDNEISTFQKSVLTSSAMNSIVKMSSDTKDSSKPYETKSVKQNTQVSERQQD